MSDTPGSRSGGPQRGPGDKAAAERRDLCAVESERGRRRGAGVFQVSGTSITVIVLWAANVSPRTVAVSSSGVPAGSGAQRI